MFVKPNIAEGRRPRDPRTLRLLPDEGMEVPDHDAAFWRGLERVGDVIIEDQPPHAA